MKKLLLIPGITLTFIVASCGNSAQQAELAAKQHTIDSMQTAADKQHVIDSMNQVQTVSQQEMPQQAQSQPVTHTRTIVRERVIERAPANTTNTTYTTTNNTTTTEPHKKGWSGTAKGAVIGAGVGAITGAMVDGRKGEGAVVGGLIGAGTGAGVGAIIDHKNKKKEANTTNKSNEK